MKICEGWVILVCGLVLFISPINAQEYRDIGDDVDYIKDSEHENNHNERSQSISHVDDHDNDNDETSFYEQLRESPKEAVHPALKYRRSISPNSPIEDSPFYISAEEVEKIAQRYRRATKSDSKTDYDNTYQRFLNENFPQDRNHDPLPARNSEYKSEPTKSQYVSRSSKQTKKHNQDDNDEDVESHHPSHFSKELTKFPSDDYERIKYESDQQAKQIKKTPGNCKTVKKKNGMECQVCNDAKTGANSESCSYSSTPDHQKYAFLRESSYDSTKDPQRNGELVAESKQKSEKTPRKRPAPKRSAPIKKKSQRPSQKKINESPPEVYKAEESRQQRDVIGLDPYLYGSTDDSKKSEADNPKSFESYYSHVFPTPQKSQKLKKSEDEYEFVPGFSNKKDVDTVLQEFKKKDWSKCKKSVKDGLTCYQCKDKAGVNFEECVFISENNPEKSRLVYEESKRFYEDGKSKHPSEKEDVEEEYDDDSDVEDTDKESTKTVTSSSKVPLKKAQTIPKKKNFNTHQDLKAVNLQPEFNDDIELTDDGTEKRTFKRTVTYKIESESLGDQPEKSVKF